MSILHNTDTSIAAIARLQEQLRDEPLRHAHEVKLVAGLETHAKRAWYIEGENGVRDHRGAEAAERLRRDVWSYMRQHGAAVEPQQEELLT